MHPQMVEFTLAGPPRGKERVKRGGLGQAYLPEKTVTYESRLAYAAQQAMGERPLFDGALMLELSMYMPVPMSKPRGWREKALRNEIRPTVKPDFDNGAKCIDALNMIVWVDDRQIVDARIRKFYSDRPRTEVRVWPIDLQEENGAFS